MNKKKEIRKILRRFCHSVPSFQTFRTEQEGLEHLEAIRKNWNHDMIRGTVIHCTVCGLWHVLREYNIQLGEHQYPNLLERKIITDAVYVEKDRSLKRKRIRRLAPIYRQQGFQRVKPVFGSIPDDGFFYTIVSDRYVCFNCRKSWRRQRYEHKMNICPHCQNEVQQVYPMFRAPRRNDIKAWTRLENRYKKRD